MGVRGALIEPALTNSLIRSCRSCTFFSSQPFWLTTSAFSVRGATTALRLFHALAVCTQFDVFADLLGLELLTHIPLALMGRLDLALRQIDLALKPFRIRGSWVASACKSTVEYISAIGIPAAHSHYGQRQPLRQQP